jgi:Family of unknown function (DUF5681)
VSNDSTPQNRRKGLRGGHSPDIGEATQFKSGQSGNPGGRPKQKPWADAYRKFGALPIDKLQITKEDTTIEACVKKTYQEMLKTPETRALREAADRIEGRVPLPLVNGEDGGFTLNLVSHIPRPNRDPKAQKPAKKAPKNVQ